MADAIAQRDVLRALPDRDDRDQLRSHHRRDIQGLRAVAVLMVVAYHVGLAAVPNPVPGGFVGVDVFFVISGFVITGVLLRRLAATGTFSFAGFYARRARRLLPALAVVLVGVTLLSTLILSPFGGQQVVARTAIGAALFSANLAMYRLDIGYFDLGLHHNPLLHTWSLGVEEQFYFVFPAFILGIWSLPLLRRRNGQDAEVRRVASVLGVAVVVSFVVGARMTAIDPRMAMYLSPLRAWEFGVGSLLALAAPSLARIPRPLPGLLRAVGGAMLVWSVLEISDGSAFPGTVAAVPVLGTGMMLAAGTAVVSAPSRVLASRVAVWLGDRSYSWYLWHWPVLVFARAIWPTATWGIVIAGAASLVPALLSYRFVENRFRYDGDYSGAKATRLGLICIALPLAVALLLAVTPRIALSSDRISDMREQLERHHLDFLNECDTKVPLGERREPQCTVGARGSSREIVLVGDSTAGQMTEPLAAAAEADGVALTIATLGACPFVDAFVRLDGRVQHDCRTFVTESLEELVRRRPQLVVLASSSRFYIYASKFQLKRPGEPEVRSRRAKAEAWEDGLRSVLNRLDAAGVPTLVVHVIPPLDGFEPRECPALKVYLERCDVTRSAAEANHDRQLALTAEREAMKGIRTAHAADLANAICPNDTCAAFRDGVWVYQDARHLTVAGAMTLVDEFVAAIRLAAPVARP